MPHASGPSRIALAAVVIALLPFASAQAQPAVDFYKANRISIVVAAPPGGGYDLNARTLARHMSRYVPGNPTIIVQNMAGADGMIGANYVYNIAPKDGTVIGAGTRPVPFAPLFDSAGARYDVNRMQWIGSTASETAVAVAWHTAPVKTADDLFKTELIIGATGPGGDLYLFPYVLNKLLGMKFKIVSGYSNLPPIGLALERGEIQGVGNYTWTTLLTGHADWLRDKKVNLLLQLGTARHADLPDLPVVMDFARTEEQRQILSVFMSMKTFGFPFFMSADAPADRVKVLQDAFNATVRDPDFQAEQKSQQREVSPTSGDAMTQSLRASYALSPAMRETLRALMPAGK
jgi:tripartite-type tricarboxylate transporter receptor subunit TctC